MSTISVSNITTANGSEPLTLSTGNTGAGDIVLGATGGVVIAPNSSVNSVIISTGSTANMLVTNSTGLFVLANVNVDAGVLFVDIANNRVGIKNTAPTSDFTVTGNVDIDAGTLFVDAVNGRVAVGGNTSPAVTLQVTGTMNVSTNTLNLGASTNAATGYTILPNQIKMNWGVVVPNSVGSNTATFSSAFTTNAYTVSLSIRASVANVGAANAKSATFSVVNNSTIVINVANNTVGVNTGVLGVHYLAIGPA